MMKLAIWVAVLAYILQTSYYTTIANVTSKRVTEFIARDANPHWHSFLPLPHLVRMSTGSGLVLGFGLSWPIAHFVGRKNGIILSNLLFPTLAVIFHWTAFLGGSRPSSFWLQSSHFWIGVNLGSLLPLYHLSIFESCSTAAWRPFAILSYFLLKSAASLLEPLAEEWIRRDYLIRDKIEEKRWPRLLNILLIPAWVQVVVLRYMAKEPHGGGLSRRKAVQDVDELELAGVGHVDHAAAVRRLANSAPDDSHKLEVVEMGPARRVAVPLVVMRFLVLVLSGPYHKDNSSRGGGLTMKSNILENVSAFNQFPAPTSILLPLVLGVIFLAWGVALCLATKLSGKVLLFGTWAVVVGSAIVRILVALTTVIVENTETSSSNEFWEAGVWAIFILDWLTTPFSTFMLSALMLLLMELGDEGRRAGLVVWPLILILGLEVLVFHGGTGLAMRPDVEHYYYSLWNVFIAEGDNNVWMLLGKWGGRLVLQLLLALGLRVLWVVVGKVQREQFRLPARELTLVRERERAELGGECVYMEGSNGLALVVPR